MKFSQVMFSDLSDEQMMQLSDRERAVWLARPRNLVPRAKNYMLLRVAILVLAAIYFSGAGEARVLLFVWAAYELAYYTTLRDKLQTEHQLARENYRQRAKEEGLIATGDEA